MLKRITFILVLLLTLFCITSCGSNTKSEVQTAEESNGQTAEFKNGPYLLAPKTDSMVVVWESTENVSATIAYGTEEGALCAPIEVKATSDVPEFQGKKLSLFSYKIENLKPGTKYYYEVKLNGGATCKANFKSLETDPESYNIMTLSDSHIFATREELDRAIKENEPAFILHCGDLVEGTGAQAEQFSFWFKGSLKDDFIHSYPVVYSSGNHDQGDVFFNTYVYNIQDKEYGAEVTGDSSFNYGKVHFITMNSNPWGLFQMNSEATGNKVDPATTKEIDRAMEWLKKDLESDAAKNAQFRVIMMHHPVSDAYTKKYIPKIIEPGKVDLLLSGHTHSYACEVSNDPSIGAGTVYLTHQDARTYNKKGDFFYISVDATKGLMTIDNYGAPDLSSETAKANTTLISNKKQQLAFSDVSISPNSLLCNDKVTIKATVTNQGSGIAAAAIPVKDNGEVRYLYSFEDEKVLLEPGESKTLTGYLKMESLGMHTLELNDQSVSVDVKFRKATFDCTNIRIKQGNEEVSDMSSNILHIKADVTNIGNESGKGSADFVIDDKKVESKEVSLDAGESKTVEFTYTFDKAGDHTATIGNAPVEVVTIEGAVQGMPLVRDLSGNENNAYIHGEPELGKDDENHQTIILDGKRDYIEIPDHGGYTVKDAVTGMVWANLPSAGTTKGGVSELTEPYEDLDGKGAIPDHNPLMVKGIGLGWGTPYLFRMAVRETGKVAYGVCLLDDNGEFSWNDGDEEAAGIKKDTWVQYTSAFDMKTGGDSYQNGYHSAHVDKPAFDAPVKNWEGEPMYIGFGFKNTIQTNRNRGMYHTMLPGTISQVRFYTTKLSADENNEILKNPTKEGPKTNDLKIWLNFENKNIETKGKHTTEWVEISSAPSSLSYDAKIEGNASISATIQISEDGKTVESEKNYILQNGNNKINLDELAHGKYARIVTEFVSDLNDKESHIPVLNEYILTAGDEKCWNTLVDWKKGTFEGAAGYQESNVYKNFASDFDDYNDSSSESDQ